MSTRDHHETAGEAAVWGPAVEIANIPTLLMMLVHMTGDLGWLEERYRPSRTRGLDDNDTGGLPEAVQTEIRAAALDAILAWRDGKPLVISEPSDELLVRMMSVSVGDPVPIEYAPVIAEELRLLERPTQCAPPPTDFGVLIIGAGISGLCAAVRLQQAGVHYTILERNADVGGTWLENRYPGCGVDTPSYLYSFSFARGDWSHHFALRDELRAYLDRIAEEFDITAHIQFDTEVLGARYEAEEQAWYVEARHAGGATSRLRANVLISAVGAFNKPSIPPIEGADLFLGPALHTARWPREGIDLRGKRLAVMGNGASAMQLVPAVADEAASIVVFQRSPQWVAPFEKFHKPVPAPLRFLLGEVPIYHDWYRLRLAYSYNDALYPALLKDPDWPHPERSLSARNDRHREFYTQYIVSELGDRQDLLEQVLPKYPPYGKRMLMDNGWFRTLTRDDVRLVSDPIDEIRPGGVVAAGEEYEADVLVWATGFDVVRFLAPMDIVGRSGHNLEHYWGNDDARAYLGTAVPDFPNFFCLYGPNAQFGHGGSLITIVDRQMHYVMSALDQMFAGGFGAVEVKRNVHDAYNVEVDAAHENMVWSHQGMSTYYRNSRGRVVAINPFRVVDFWAKTGRADLDEYHTEPAVAPDRAAVRTT